MENKDSITKEEQTHLAEALAIAKAELAGIVATLQGMEKDMQEAKEDARENVTYGASDMSNPDDFEAFVELSQTMSHVDKMVSDYDEYQKRVKQLQALILKPYFARIDFQFDEYDSEQIYIGRRSLTDKKTKDICIYDWRTPIASVFYRFLPGEAFYEAPCGRVNGQLTLKRQFEIKDSRLAYFFDSDRAIEDEILRQILSQNTSPKMKAIVETIQGDQDIIIRDMENDLLMVQGVAGSGKTSIALHRAAYLMYQEVQSGLNADNILILSPNSTFEDYIAGVLPELGEENVTSAVFRDLLKSVIREYYIEPHYEYLEHILAGHSNKALRKTAMQLKTSEHFLELLNFFLEEIPEHFIAYQDIYHKGKCLMTADSMKKYLCKRPSVPFMSKLKQLSDSILEAAFPFAARSAAPEEILEFTKNLQEILALNLIEVYKAFLTTEAYAEELIAEVGDADIYDKIVTRTLTNLEGGRLEFDDACAIAYLALKLSDKGRKRHIRQVVIDEAQDYYPIQFEIIQMLFPNAKYTVLGDINQTLVKQETADFYHKVQGHLHKDKASLVTLNKSFRCTSEILQYSLRFLDNVPLLESFNRTGGRPALTQARDTNELAAKMQAEINACIQKGYQSICLICKSAANAAVLHELLTSMGDACPLKPKLIVSHTEEELTGLFVMPVYLSKGLEFDAVFICDADDSTYQDDDDRKLLYVSCTRALHRLSLFCTGTPSRLLSDSPEIK